MAIIWAPEFSGVQIPDLFASFVPVINNTLSPGLNFFIRKNHKILVRIMEYALLFAWTLQKGSVVWERRKPNLLNIYQHLDSLRQWSDTFMRQSNDLIDERDAKWKFTWETWPFCIPLPILLPCSIVEGFALLSLNNLLEYLCSVTHVAVINPWVLPPGMLLGKLYSRDPLKHQYRRIEIDFIHNLFFCTSGACRDFLAVQG